MIQQRGDRQSPLNVSYQPAALSSSHVAEAEDAWIKLRAL